MRVMEAGEGGMGSWKERFEGYKKDREGRSTVWVGVSLLVQKVICLSVCLCVWLLRKTSRHLALA